MRPFPAQYWHQINIKLETVACPRMQVLDKNKFIFLCFYNLLLVIPGTPAKNSSPKPTLMTTVNVLKVEENDTEEKIQQSSQSESS